MGEQALQVLGMAYRNLTGVTDLEDNGTNLTFLGLAGMIDPPRQSAIQLLKHVKRLVSRLL